MRISLKALQNFLAVNTSQPENLLKLKGLPIVHHEGYVCDLPSAHMFPMNKFAKVMEYLIADNIVSQNKQIIKPEKFLQK